MDRSLDGARLKVVRAKQHLETFKSAVALYIESDPCAVIVDKNDDILPHRTEISEFDPLLRTFIGDCIHNLRSALDYIVWDLASCYAGRELVGPPFGKDRPSFPHVPLMKSRRFSLTRLGINRSGSSISRKTRISIVFR